MNLINKLSKHDLVRGLPKLKYERDHICDACMKGKQISISFKPSNEVSTYRPLTLLHLDLFRLMRTLSIGGKHYTLIIVDDYSRFTWVIFLGSKNKTYKQFKIFSKRIQKDKGICISRIRSDHREKFENEHFKHLCEDNGIEHNFSCARTPQQNGVVERKNRSLQEMARIMLCDKNLLKNFWTEAVNTSCYILNRVSIRPILKKMPYEPIKEDNHILHIFTSLVANALF